MDPIAWQALAWLIGLIGPWLVGRIRRRPNLAALTALINILCISAQVIVEPSPGGIQRAVLVGALLVLNLGLWVAPPVLEHVLVGTARRRGSKVLLACLAAALIPLALVEQACQVLTELRFLKYHKGIETVWRSGVDDWRLATITGDESREPDPVLLWRPVPRPPFSAQRFKGPLVDVPKPERVVRVMCYGDSLTDGPPRGGWPTWLQRFLADQPPVAGRRFEVVNAGVAGYSSHQGLKRFLQEVDEYTPDMLLVSFGWNDAADASGQPDKSFRVPPWPIVACQRALIRYRAYLVMMYYTKRWRTSPPAASSETLEHRVSVEDYLANLERFRREAQARGIPIAFLTRPHRCSPDELSEHPTWRQKVPAYNAALLDWARKNDALVLDVQRAFEQRSTTLFADECHFTPQGYEQMGRLVYEQIALMGDGLRRESGTAANASPAAVREAMRDGNRSRGDVQLVE